MIIVNKTEKDIAGAINGKSYSIPYNEAIFNMLKGIETDFNKLEESDVKLAKELTEAATKLVTLDYNEVIATKNEFLSFNPVSKKYYLTFNKGQKNERVDYRPIPQALVDKIQSSFDAGFDFMPVVKAWARFLHRKWFKPFSNEDAELFANYLTATFIDPDIVQECIDNGLEYEIARERATFQDIALTMEGLLATYKCVDEVKEEWIIVKDDEGQPVLDASGKPVKKKVRMAQWRNSYEVDKLTGETITTESKPKFAEDRVFTPAICKDGQKFFTGDKYSYMYKVGERQYLPGPGIKHPNGEESIINYHNTFGGGGLYSGGLTYIQNYRNDDNIVLICFIDPANIISFQDEGKALRTFELFPYGILEDDTELKSLYHSSKYAEQSKERVKSYVEEVIKTEQEALNEQQARLQTEKDIDNDLNKF